MKLYFENSKMEKRKIADIETEDLAYKEMKTFCDERNFEIHYIRSWKNDIGFTIFDVGSHSEFFILTD